MWINPVDKHPRIVPSGLSHVGRVFIWGNFSRTSSLASYRQSIGACRAGGACRVGSVSGRSWKSTGGGRAGASAARRNAAGTTERVQRTTARELFSVMPDTSGTSVAEAN